jgi:SAM-dependent methyltransferase
VNSRVGKQGSAGDLAGYRASPREQRRVADLLALMPASGESALDVGARDGHLSRLMVERYTRVVAVDLTQPEIDHPRIECWKADATGLPFDDDSFDCVLCAEVLEHIPGASLAKACRELARVARHAVVVGVPYKQDLRSGRTRCGHCGGINPPWGHVNSFDEARLRELFRPLPATRISYVGSTRQITNAMSAALMDFAGNPFGTYEQDEPCVHCNEALTAPAPRNGAQKVATRLAFIADSIQRRVSAAHANWIHVRCEKR